jgi:hypothetical protein
MHAQKCCEAAAHKKKALRRATHRGYRIHSDLKEWPQRSKKGYKYSICFVDDATRRGKTYAMKTKDQSREMLERFLREECSSRSIRVRVLRSDSGGEYIGAEFQAWCAARGIRQEFSAPDCQSGNGTAENYWREMAKYVRAVLWDQQRGDEWWPTGLDFADSIRNSLECESVDGSGVPEVEWTGQAIDTTHYRVPLCTAWSFVEKAKRDGGTLGDRRMKGIFVGYARQSPCYQVYDPLTDRVYNRRHADVTFDEREAVPAPDRLMKGGLRDIAEGDESDEEMQQVDHTNGSGGGDSGKTEVVHTPAAPSTFKHGDGEFLRLTKQRTVKDLAELFTCEPGEYLHLLWQYDGWFQDLKTIRSVVKKGADVPVPQTAQALREIVCAPTKAAAAASKNAGRCSEGQRRSPAQDTRPTRIIGADAATGGASYSTTRSRNRRSPRVRAAERRAALDAAALLTLAVEFERQAKADVSPSGGPGSTEGTVMDAAMYLAD